MKKKIIFTILVLISLTPLFWFEPGSHVIQSAGYTPLDPVEDIKSVTYLWGEQTHLGAPTKHLVRLPYIVFWAFFRVIGFEVLTIEKLFFCLMIFMTGYSIWYLLRALLKKNGLVPSIIAILFFVFNLYVVIKILILPVYIVYWMLPLMIGMCLKYFESKKRISGALKIGLLSIIAVPIAINPPHYVAFFLTITILVFLRFAFIKKKGFGFKENLKSLIVLLLIFFLFNVWWILPVGYQVFSGLGSYTLLGQKISDFSKASSFFNNFVLQGHWALFGSHRGDPYYPYFDTYQKWWLMLIMFIFPILAFSNLLRKKVNKYVIFFSLIGVLGLFMAKGTHPPLHNFTDFLYRNVPFFWVFQNQYMKFMPVILVSYAFLLAVSADHIYLYIKKRFNKRYSNIFIFSLITLILIAGWPLLLGDVVREEQIFLKSEHAEIPNYWYEASEYLNNQEETSRILTLPPNRFNSEVAAYYWGYSGRGMEIYLIHKPLFTADPRKGSSPQSELSVTTSNEIFNHISKSGNFYPSLSGIFNTRYILQRNDYDLEYRKKYTNYETPEGVKKVLEKNDNEVILERNFGDLDIYRIK